MLSTSSRPAAASTSPRSVTSTAFGSSAANATPATARFFCASPTSAIESSAPGGGARSAKRSGVPLARASVTSVTTTRRCVLPIRPGSEVISVP